MANLTIGNRTADSSYSLLLDANIKVKYNDSEMDLISASSSLASDSAAQLQAASVYTVYTAIIGAMRSSY